MFILRLAFYLSLFFLALDACIAQSNFHSGYIVTNHSDTLNGLVDNRTETKNGRFIHFKNDSTAEIVKYEPTDLMAYGFDDNKMYKSTKIRSDSSEVMVFMELLVKGTINLYHYKDDGRFYVEKGGHSTKALYQTEIKVMHEGRYYIKKRKDYLGVLRFLMSDCAATGKSIDRIQLERRQLMELVNNYNECGLNEESFQTKRTFLLIRKGILAGGQTTKINFIASIPYYAYLANANFSTDIQPFGGVFVNTTFPWITQKVSLQAEAQFAKAHYYSDSERVKLQGTLTIHDEITIDMAYFRFPVFLRYTYPKGKYRPYFQAGATFDIVTRKDVYMIHEERWRESVYANENYSLVTRKLQSFGMLGGGIAHPILKKLVWFVEARAFIGDSLITPSVSAIYKARTKVFALQTGFSF